MSRSHFTLDCVYDSIACTLDHAPGAVGLLMVSGGNETRAGAFSGQAQMAARIAATGFPVLRFDRRGVGDSTGENAGFQGISADLAAAMRAFSSASPGLRRVVAFGNCDAASALLLNPGAGCDALALATFDGPVRVLLASNERTAQAFMQAMPETRALWDICPDAGHAFAGDEAANWLFARLSALLHEQARQLDVG